MMPVKKSLVTTLAGRVIDHVTLGPLGSEDQHLETFALIRIKLIS
jgi:hypothetical protein